jgi:hypothetical protein
MAQIAGSISIGSLLAPTDSLNTYAVYEDIYNRGGFRTVATTEEMQQITRDRRKIGMMVYVVSTGKAWILTSEPHTTYSLSNPLNVGDTHIMPYSAYGPTSGGFAGSSFNISMGQSNQAGAYTTGGGDDIIAETNATGNWTEFEPGGGGGEYTQSELTQSITGGVVSNESFTAVSTSDMFDSLLYGPEFETFKLTGYTLDTNYTNPTIIVEAKTTIPANTTFEWSNINDIFISPTTAPEFTLTAVTDPTDITNNTATATAGYPGTYTSSNTIMNVGGVAGPGAENEGFKDYKVQCVSLTNMDYEKTLRVYWRHKWLIGSAGNDFSNLGMQFECGDNTNAVNNTLAQLESGSGNTSFPPTWTTQCNSDVTKYILDPLNFDYSTWYPLVETNGANNPHHICLFMPKDYWQLITGQAFVPSKSTIDISFSTASATQSQKGLIQTTTLHNHYFAPPACVSNGNTIEVTENGTDYIGFTTNNAGGYAADAFKIESFNS